nr:immunoglobulin light chain junction region [Macaca mulatta]MOY14649.1 immunoglobulin light chain junction region [Macaca mulatta]MOY14720.1 immunoglobulin light chain junction region [Macaca mulatta]MOY14754.1 immunoglobulin light chain junction region [Macaca mulatta]MOY14823.1 immunoglobulin light chain junction region [Macaca mulatta]
DYYCQVWVIGSDRPVF